MLSAQRGEESAVLQLGPPATALSTAASCGNDLRNKHELLRSPPHVLVARCCLNPHAVDDGDGQEIELQIVTTNLHLEQYLSQPQNRIPDIDSHTHTVVPASLPRVASANSIVSRSTCCCSGVFKISRYVAQLICHRDRIASSMRTAQFIDSRHIRQTPVVS